MIFWFRFLHSSLNSWWRRLYTIYIQDQGLSKCCTFCCYVDGRIRHIFVFVDSPVLQNLSVSALQVRKIGPRQPFRQLLFQIQKTSGVAFSWFYGDRNVEANNEYRDLATLTSKCRNRCECVSYGMNVLERRWNFQAKFFHYFVGIVSTGLCRVVCWQITALIWIRLASDRKRWYGVSHIGSLRPKLPAKPTLLSLLFSSICTYSCALLPCSSSICTYSCTLIHLKLVNKIYSRIPNESRIDC